MNINIFVVAYGLPDDLLRCYHAANSDDVTWRLFLHSQQPAVIAACELLSARSNVVYYPYGTNRGLARSTNEALIDAQESGADVFIVYHDDMLGSPMDIHLLADCVLANPERSYVDGMSLTERTGGYEPTGMAAAAINLKAVKRVGYFDQNFHPFYFEDADWKYRTRLSGMHPITHADTKFVHGGSKTLTHSSDGQEVLGQAFPVSKDYYLRKWGGDQKQEVYRIPFNDPRYDLTIPRERIGNPYPEYAAEETAL